MIKRAVREYLRGILVAFAGDPPLPDTLPPLAKAARAFDNEKVIDAVNEEAAVEPMTSGNLERILREQGCDADPKLVFDALSQLASFMDIDGKLYAADYVRRYMPRF